MRNAPFEHRLGRVDEFPVGTHKVVRIGRRREVGIFNIEGRFYGLPNLCPHQTGPLCEGRSLTGTLRATPGARGTWDFEWVMEGEVIVCPWHGLEFHVPTARCLAFPKLRLRSYDVLVRGDDLVVRL